MGKDTEAGAILKRVISKAINYTSSLQYIEKEEWTDSENYIFICSVVKDYNKVLAEESSHLFYGDGDSERLKNMARADIITKLMINSDILRNN